jgi:protein involved in polysaccharide export with SLBB domain
LIGSITAIGMTVSATRDKIETSLRKYVQEPSVAVEVAEYHSKPIYLMGQFRTPGVYYMTPHDLPPGNNPGQHLMPPPTCAAYACCKTKDSTG